MKNKIMILVGSVIIVGTVVFIVLSQRSTSSGPRSYYGYNPNYADAIQQKKPELCKDISYALKSAPTDAIDKFTGDEAVQICETQARAGVFECECDDVRTLNEMRNRN